LGSGHRRSRERAVQRAQRPRGSEQADRHLLLRRRVRGLAHARREVVGHPVQQRLRLQGRLPRLAEARRRRAHGSAALTFRERLAHPWLTTRVQIFLGLIFVVAALPKIVDPPSFAHMVYYYRILPGGLINISAIVTPWV